MPTVVALTARSAAAEPARQRRIREVRRLDRPAADRREPFRERLRCLGPPAGLPTVTRRAPPTRHA